MTQPAAFLSLIQQPVFSGQYLVEIDIYIGGEARSGGLSTLTEIPLASSDLDSGVDVGETTLRYSDHPWIGEPDELPIARDGLITETVNLSYDDGGIT